MNHEILEEMWNGSTVTEKELIARIVNSTDAEELAHNLARLITKQPLIYSDLHLGGSSITDFLAKHPHVHRGVLNSLLNTHYKVTDYAAELYERDHGAARETLNTLHLYPREHRVPHLDILIATMMRHTGRDWMRLNEERSYRVAVAEAISDGHLLQWCKDVIREGKYTLKHYAGQTNTIFGLYGGMFDWRSGIIEADHYVDLGGGYSTPDISSISGKPFVSYDLIPPTQAEALGLVFKSIPNERFIPEKLIQSAYRSLRSQEYVPFDVYKDKFPEGDRHVVVSTGFMSSTVGSLSTEVDTEKLDGHEIMMATSLQSCRSVAELVMRGGSVQLITIGRPQWRVYKNGTINIQFKDRRAVKVERTLPWCDWSTKETLYGCA